MNVSAQRASVLHSRWSKAGVSNKKEHLGYGEEVMNKKAKVI